MPLRIVGVGSLVVGLGIVALGLDQLGVSHGIASILSSGEQAWSLPISREVFMARSRIWSGVVMLVGALTALGGWGMILKRRWGFFATVAAAVLMLVFPLMSRILLPKAYAFDALTLVDFGIVAVAGLSAALAWMFRS